MSLKSLSIWMFIFLLFAFAGVFLVSSSQKPDFKPKEYKSNETQKPNVEIKEFFFNMGEILVKDEKSKNFEIKNSGKKPLQIFAITTSCGCTAAQIIYKEKISQEFSMHTVSNYKIDIAPGDSAKIRVTYRPSVMPVYGSVTREIYVSTNDPKNPKLVFKIKAFVK